MRQARGVVEGIQRLYESGTLAALPDGEILARFVERGDRQAFEALVARHGGLVLAVCRDALADPDDVADAFQATFLVLVRKAASVRVADTLGPWLYGVARKVSARARANAAARRRREANGSGPALDAAPAPTADVVPPETVRALMEELDRLPDRLRAPIVLCHLQGLTHDEAAVHLRCPVGTVRSRLSRGRDRLRDRLTRRGFDGPSAFALFRPPAVREELAAAAARLAAGGAAPAPIRELTEGVLMAIAFTPWRWAATATLAAGLCVVGPASSAPQAPAPAPGSAAAAQADPTDEALRRRLVQPVTINLQAVPFRRAVDELAAQTGLKLLIDADSLRRRGVDDATPVTLRRADAPLGELLDELASGLGLARRVGDGVVRLTDPPAGTTVKVYYVSDVLARPRPGEEPAVAPAESELRRLIGLITGLVAPGTWIDHGGGPGAIGTIGTIAPVALNPGLNVRQTPEVHHKIAALLDGIRALPAIRVGAEAFKDQPPAANPPATTGPKPAAMLHPSPSPSPLFLALTGPKETRPGLAASYRLVVTNRGLDTLPAVPVQVLFSRECTPVSSNHEDFQESWGVRTLEWTVRDLHPGASSTIPFILTLGPNPLYTIQAQAVAPEVFPDRALLVVVDTLTIGKPVASVQPGEETGRGGPLVVHVVGPDAYTPGETVNYRVGVHNVGPVRSGPFELRATAPAATRFATIPAGATGTDDGRRLSWSIDTLSPDGRLQFPVQVRAGADGPLTLVGEAVVFGTVVARRVRVSPKKYDPPPVAALYLTILPDRGRGEVGQPIRYVLKITNGSAVAATDVNVNAKVSGAAAFREGGGDAGRATGGDNGTVLFPRIGRIEPRGSKTLTIDAQAEAAGRASLSVDLSHAGRDGARIDEQGVMSILAVEAPAGAPGRP